MGLYINPTHETKEEWLEDHGDEVPREVYASFNFDNEQLPVCLVINPGFSAAGIADTPAEREAHLERHIPIVQQRPKKFYFVMKSDLAPWMKDE